MNDGNDGDVDGGDDDDDDDDDEPEGGVLPAACSLNSAW